MHRCSLALLCFCPLPRRVFLPVMVYYAAQMEGQHVSLSALDRRCADLFFYWVRLREGEEVCSCAALCKCGLVLQR